MSLTPAQLDAIPDHLFKRHALGAVRLIEWLHTHGWRMSLAELEDERARRGVIGGGR